MFEEGHIRYRKYGTRGEKKKKEEELKPPKVELNISIKGKGNGLSFCKLEVERFKFLQTWDNLDTHNYLRYVLYMHFMPHAVRNSHEQFYPPWIILLIYFFPHIFSCKRMEEDEGFVQGALRPVSQLQSDMLRIKMM